MLQIVEDHEGGTYRAVYTVRFSDAIYVLHAFQKKSRKGIATPKHELDLIRARLEEAEAIHQERTRKEADERDAEVHRKQRKRLR